MGSAGALSAKSSAIAAPVRNERLTKISHEQLLEFAKQNAGNYFPTVARKRLFMVDVIDDQIVCYPESKIDVWLTPKIQLKHFNATNDLRPGKYPAETFSNSYFVALVAAMIRDTQPITPNQLPGGPASALPPSRELDAEVRRLRKAATLPPPKGQAHPAKKKVVTLQICRDPAVKAWVLKMSKGKCACCREAAPFKDDDNLPFLEVHHVVPLGEGGADTINNAVALCPNCHRAVHHAKDRKVRIAQLHRTHPRLKKSAP